MESPAYFSWLRRFLAFVLCAIMFLSVSCSFLIPSDPFQTAEQENVTGTLAIPTETIVVVTTPTPPTPSLTLTITPVSTPIRMPMATLQKNEADRYAQELLRKENSCLLPCWWGITPGETSWNDVYQFLSPLGTRVVEEAPRIICKENQCVQVVRFSVDFDPGDRTGAWASIIMHDGIVEKMNFNQKATGYRYRLNQLLSESGMPDKVYIRTFTSMPDGSPPPFTVVVYYSEKGILARYEFVARKIGDKLMGCPIPVGPWLNVWVADVDLSEETINEWVLVSDPTSLFKPLEEATNMDIELFYKTFRESLDQDCIETPQELW